MNRLFSLPVIEVDPVESSPGESSSVESLAGLGRWMVVIFDNDDCSMDEVVEILMLATGCDVQEAFIEMWEAHTFGKASVHFSSHEECDVCSKIISSIGVKTEVCPEWQE